MFPRSPEALNSFWSMKCAWLIGLFQKCLSIHLSVNVQILQKFVFHQPKAQADLIISAIIPLYAHLFSSILTLKDFRLVTKKNKDHSVACKQGWAAFHGCLQDILEV